MKAVSQNEEIVCYPPLPKMAVGDQTWCCTHHQDAKVALFCQSCEELICTKCISQGPNSSARHHDHTYLDLHEAYDIQKEELEKVLAIFNENIQTKKNERKELQSKIQNLKFELLRKKTQVEKKVKSAKDAIRKNESTFMKNLAKIIEPAIARTELRHNDVEYEVVSREGLIGTCESIQALPPSKSIPFLKMVAPVKRDMKTTNKKIDKPYEDSLTELAGLKKINLSLQQTIFNINKSFSLAQTEPSPPRLLPNWCTVGIKSASITWKFSVTDCPRQFRIYYRPYRWMRKQQTYHGPEKITFEEVQHSLGYKCLKVKRYTNKRTGAIIKNLSPNTPYEVKLTTVNDCGESVPTSWFLVTLGNGDISGNLDRRPPKLCSLRCVLKHFSWSLAMLFLFTYAIISVYLFVHNYEQILVPTCDYIRHYCVQNDWMEEEHLEVYLDTVCPQKIIISQKDLEQVDSETTSVGGRWFDWF